MKKQNDSQTAAVAAREPDPGRLFSEIGISATFFDSMPAEIVIVGENGDVLAANDKFRKGFGDTLGLVWANLLINDQNEVKQNLRTAFKRGFHSFGIFYNTPEESPREFQIDAFTLTGNKLRAALIHRPQRLQTGFWMPGDELIRRESEEPVQRADFYDQYEKAHLAVVAVDTESKISFASSAAENLLPSGSPALTGRNINNLFNQNNESFDTKEEVWSRGEHCLSMPGAAPVWLYVQELPGYEDERLLVLTDISDRKSEESELRSVFELYRIFVNQSDNDVFRFDLSEPLPTDLDTEKAAETILYSAVLSNFVDLHRENAGVKKVKIPAGTIFQDFFGSHEVALEVAKHFIEGDYTLFQKEILETPSEGGDSYFSTNLIGVIEEGKLVKIWLSRRDITQRKQAEKAHLLAEDQLRQSQKIEPIGRLAGGIAHDFNNFLAVIMLQIEMMNQELDESSPLRHRVEEILTVTDKAANMVRQLLAFGRKQTMQPYHVILNEVVAEFIKMTRSLIGEDIEIELDLEADLGVCFVDPNQITQILMNLAINSKDAMPAGGKLRITTANISIDEGTFKHRAQPKGRYIQLSVEDTGIGMDAATRKHVFEPFFTTKAAHKGTGLGLATVYGIVKQSKGFIWVDSKVDEGTRFRVQFPRTDSPATVIKPEKVSSIPRGTETILLVEDEALIRKTSLEVLESLGYNILEASDGEEAARIASEFEGNIDLLLTDVVMPRMNGRELAKEVKTLHPELSVLFMSGYADDIITRHGILEKDVHFLGKPFSPLMLALSVREALATSKDR